jgi:glutathione S-transferase
LLLGFKKLSWRSVIIPIIMPKPDVVALTGGYRKTPILQIGADIYCDTALIARVLDRLAPTPPLLPAPVAGNAAIVAAWADSVWFSAGVGYATQPAGMKSMFADFSDEQLAAFANDRKAFREGASVLRMPLEAATTLLKTHLVRMQSQFSAGKQPFVLGEAACIADFSLYHGLWFITRAPAVAGFLDAYPAVKAWMARMAAFGHGKFEPLDSAQAVEIAKSGRREPTQVQSDAGSVAAGAAVTINATDYGVNPAAGKLVGASSDEWVIERQDPRAGTVNVHFPRNGYKLTVPEAA